MTAAHRPQDLADVIELIRVNRLPLAHAALLNPYVAEKFCELWRAAFTATQTQPSASASVAALTPSP